MILTIQGRLMALNEYTQNCRNNRYLGAKAKKNTQEHIKREIRANKGITACAGKVFIDFHWYEPNMKRDKDNVAFAKKFILDALVEEGILTSDGWRVIDGFADHFYVDKKEPRVEVEIKEV